MKNKKQTLYTFADWKHHKGKMGYDDLIDSRGRLVVTISVMDIARDDILNDSYLDKDADLPKKIFLEGKDNGWHIFLNSKWLTPSNIEVALNDFGNLVGKKFTFEPHILPKELRQHWQAKNEEWSKEVKEISPADVRRSEAFTKKLKKDVAAYEKRKINKIPRKRLFEIITHKLK